MNTENTNYNLDCQDAYTRGYRDASLAAAELLRAVHTSFSNVQHGDRRFPQVPSIYETAALQGKVLPTGGADKDYKPHVLERVRRHPGLTEEQIVRELTPGPRLCKRVALSSLVEAGDIVKVTRRGRLSIFYANDARLTMHPSA